MVSIQLTGAEVGLLASTCGRNIEERAALVQVDKT